MTDIRRYDTNGAPIFITAVCHERLPLLKATNRKHLLLNVMREVKGETSFQMLGYVILDDHFHWLIKPKGADISKIMQSVKLRFTRRLGAEKPKHSWQKRFWDHVIRDENDFQRHLDYIHYNPVKHGFAAAPADYEFSSFGFYLANDKYVINWGRDSEPSQIGSLALE